MRRAFIGDSILFLASTRFDSIPSRRIAHMALHCIALHSHSAVTRPDQTRDAANESNSHQRAC